MSSSRAKGLILYYRSFVEDIGKAVDLEVSAEKNMVTYVIGQQNVEQNHIIRIGSKSVALV